MVLAGLNTVFAHARAQYSFDSAITQWRVVANELRAKLPKPSELTDGA
jgi:hypothetical protein